MIYIANIRLPTEKAHGLQIMKTCEAFVKAGEPLTLVVPRRRNTIHDDPFAYYGIKRRFSVQRVATVDSLAFGMGYWIQLLTFSVAALWYVRSKRNELMYSRDEFVLYLLSFFSYKCVWESHVGRYNFIIRRVLRCADQIVVISEGLREFYVERGVQKDKIIVAHDGVSLEEFDRAESTEVARKRLGLPYEKKKIALYVGRLDGWKGAEIFCRSAESVGENAQLVVIGGESEQVAAFKTKYPKVLFLGFHPYREIADNLAAADILVLPNTACDPVSLRFTSPLKLFTYMAAKKPIIASDLPSIREVLGDPSCYFVVPDDPKAIATAVRQVLGEPGAALQKAEEAYRLVAEYTWDARVQRILASFRQG